MNPSISRQDLESLLINLSSWLLKPNIVGLCVRNKRVKNEEMNDLAIVVYVIRKKQTLDLEDFPIPKSVEIDVLSPDGSVQMGTVPTDVVESGNFKEQNQCKDENLDDYVRPCTGGCQIEGNDLPGSSGTLGVNTVYAGRFSLLSCNHVISHNGKNSCTVWQPRKDSLKSDYIIGNITNHIRVKSYKQEKPKKIIYNEYDIAWAAISAQLGSPYIPCIGLIKGIRPPKDGEHIRLIGKATKELKEAYIVTTHGWQTYYSSAFKGYVWFKNLIQLSECITRDGDSGAAYVGDDNYVVGLHMGMPEGMQGDHSFSFGCWIPTK